MIKWLVGIFAVICLTTILVVATCAWQSYRFWFQAPQNINWTVNFEVKSGEGLSQIADKLEEEDLVASAFWFRVYVMLAGESKNIQAGTFEIPGEISYSAITDILGAAKSTDVSLTIPEGYTIKQIGVLVESKFKVTPDEWLRLTGVDSPFESHQFILDAKKPDDVDLEGYLFPDTYRFTQNAIGEEIVLRLLETMQQRIESLNVAFPEVACEDSDCPEIENIHELLTIASIIEREVRQPETMKMVSDILLKRLKIGMALQVDSSVNYVTGGDSPSVSLDDLKIDSLYNTYKYPGLPPGPISSPGLNAISAAVNPTANNYFFFLTTSNGEVYYAETHEEHVANKNNYLR